MSEFYCQSCGDPVESHKPAPYQRKVPGLSLHVGESYLMSQKMSGLEPDEREQLKNWAHPITVVNGKGEPMSLNIGRQFRR